jgi:hypothetical protein
MTLTELLDKYRVEYRKHGQHHHVGANWLGMDCPDCSPGSGRFRLGYNLSLGYFSCWSCGKKYFSTTALRLTSGRASTKELSELLVKRPRDKRLVEAQEGGCYVPPTLFATNQPTLENYLVKRGFDAGLTSKRWALSLCRVNNERRLFIPIFWGEQAVSWTSRRLHDEGGNSPRYLTAKPNEEALSHKKILYGLDHCRDSVIVVEGPFDVWRIGFGAVCTFGVAYTRSQIALLSRYPTRVICYDAERDAQKRARKLCRELSAFGGTTHNVVLDAKDPAEASQEEIRELRETYLE